MVQTMTEGFKHTEVGMIPSDWEVKKVGECLWRSPDYGINAAAVPYNENLPVYLRITDITEEGNYSKKNLVSVNNLSSSSYFLQEGDLVFARTGASVGKTYLYNPKDGKLVFAGFLIRLRVNKEVLLPNFLKFFTQTKPYWDWIAANSMRTGQPGINGNEYKELQIPLPTLAEQTAIATALNDADALIQKLEQLIAKKRHLKTGAMQELLRPKEGWEVKKLGEIGECIIGLTYSPSNVKSEGKLVLRSSNIKGNRLAYEDNVFVDVQVSERLIVRKGDILICVRNGSRNLIGKCAYIDGKAIGETFGAFMSVFRSPYNDFVFHAFQSHCIQRQIEETIGATINQLTNKNLNSFEIPFPNPIEQTRIACILSDMDNEIQALETQLEQYKRVKQGMMQSLLTGKIRLV